MNLRCLLGIHKWDVWSEQYIWCGLKFSLDIFSVRDCLRCEKHQHYHNDVWFDATTCIYSELKYWS